jgi:hypothetical protein
MYNPAYLVRLAALAGSLPAGSPARVAAAHRLKIADAEFNLFTRLCIMLGAAGHPFTEVARAKREGVRGLVSRIQSLKPELPNLDPEWFDNRNVNHPNFYNLLYGTALKRVRDPEKAMELVSVATAGADDAHGNLAYQLGKSRRADGLTDLTAAANALAKNLSTRGLDLLRQETRTKSRDTTFDTTPSGGDEGKSLAETLSESGTEDYFNLILDSPEGLRVLQILDRNLDFTGAASQQAVWDAIKEDPSLLSSNMNLARAYAERTGKTVSPQGVGQVKQKVLEQARAVAETNPAVQRQLSMLEELSSLRRASAKKKRLAALLRAASVVKNAYDKGMLDDALKLLTETDTAMRDLAEVLDAQHGGKRSVSDAFNTASDLSRWLRGDASKQFDTYANKFREQARSKTAALTPQQKSVLDAMGQGATLDYEGRSKHSRGGYALTLANGTFDRSVNERVVLALEEAGLIERTSNPQGRTVFKLAR